MRLHAEYNLVHELGRGGYATVVKALSRKDGQFYAIKTIKLDKISQPTKADCQEIQILEELSHPNIYQIKEVFYEKQRIGEYYMYWFVPFVLTSP